MSDYSETEQLARLRLTRTDSIGPITFHHLVQQFGSAAKALDKLPELALRGGRKKALKVPSLKAAKDEIAAHRDAGHTILFHGSADYPKRLAAIDDAPPVLITKGHTHLLYKDCVAIVGARNASSNGHTIAGRLAARLTSEGYVVSSGLARGIDTAAHKAAIEGGTIACVAGGVDIIYPKENAALYDEIAAQGCLVSEMPNGNKPTARHFPRRNRLISGLSLAVIVVEAAIRSGSLITARVAADQGREVMAVPGSPLDARAGGTNQLIKEGAALIASSDDVIEALQALRQQPLAEPDRLPLFDYAGDDTEVNTAAIDRVRDLLSPNTAQIDDIIRAANLPAGSVMAALLSLELAGVAYRLPGQRVALKIDDW